MIPPVASMAALRMALTGFVSGGLVQVVMKGNDFEVVIVPAAAAWAARMAIVRVEQDRKDWTVTSAVVASLPALPAVPGFALTLPSEEAFLPVYGFHRRDESRFRTDQA